MIRMISAWLLAMCLICYSFVFAEPQEPLPLYGAPTATSILVRLVNGTEDTITEISLLPVWENQPADQPGLLGTNVFPTETQIGLWFDLRPDTRPTDSLPLYDIRLMFASGETGTLHNVPVRDIGEAVICRDANVVWLTYIDLTTGEEVSTWLDELTILAEQEAPDRPVTNEEREPSDWDPDRSS